MPTIQAEARLRAINPVGLERVESCYLMIRGPFILSSQMKRSVILLVIPPHNLPRRTDRRNREQTGIDRTPRGAVLYSQFCCLEDTSRAHPAQHTRLWHRHLNIEESRETLDDLCLQGAAQLPVTTEGILEYIFSDLTDPEPSSTPDMP